MNDALFELISRVIIFILSIYCLINYKTLGIKAINDRSKLLSYFGLKLPGSKEMNIRIAQVLNLLVSSGAIIFIILDLVF